MTLPFARPVAPMLAKPLHDLPLAEGMWYEPKWDGFRCVVFRDGDDIELDSRNEKPLTRYFPEVVDMLLRQLPEQCVVDGEIVIAGPNGLEFDALSQRIHPAASRVNMLAETTPASFIAFDLLAHGDDDLRDAPYAQRRKQLEKALKKARPPLHLTPATDDPEVASDWFNRFEGAGLDGVIAKPGNGTYLAGKRAMFKIKHERTADCVVAGFRWHKEGGIVGSLLLGLNDDRGVLHHVGITSSFTAARRLELVKELEPYRKNATKNHPWISDEREEGRVPGGVSRWSSGKDLSWEPLRPELVCEVAYDHLQEQRFRHATTFRRWRPDRKTSSCTYDQLDTPVPAVLHEVFGARG
ncbi:MAG TPA: ATP-dependent DNA ligase [Acidimicrobiales bacterium]|nr:ATP-dependent DNA ligase [Acidimicrobiales bacterium]